MPAASAASVMPRVTSSPFSVTVVNESSLESAKNDGDHRPLMSSFALMTRVRRVVPRPALVVSR